MIHSSVLQSGRDFANHNKPPEKHKEICPITEYIDKQAKKLMAHVIRAPAGDPLRQVTYEYDTMRLRKPDRRRVGGPKQKWTEKTLEHMWPTVVDEVGNLDGYTHVDNFDHDDMNMMDSLRFCAELYSW